jgi:type II secretory pathway pseudopilin PulG
MKTLVITIMIAAFSATIVLPSLSGHDVANAATKKKDKKKP